MELPLPKASLAAVPRAGFLPVEGGECSEEGGGRGGRVRGGFGEKDSCSPSALHKLQHR